MRSLDDGDVATRLSSDEKLKVFISYSRKDLAFAREIAKGLSLFGEFQISIDTEAIHEGEAWQARLRALIEAADTVVFILTPHSAESPICQWEVDEAERLSKRILPVQAAPLEGSKPPERLAALHYVRFDPQETGEPRSFIEGLVALQRALNTDVEWLREHTRLLVRAREWDAAGRAPNRMLSGADIAAAKEWAARRPREAPEITELHLEYIRASEQEETDRTNAERQRLKEIALAQDAREEALKAAEDAQAARARTMRRTYMGITVLAAIVLLGGPPIYRAFLDQRAIEAEALRTDIKGYIFAYSTDHGEIGATSSPTSLSPYTSDLISALRNPRTNILTALSHVNRLAIQKRGDFNLPLISTNMSGDIYLWKYPESRRLTAFVFGAWKYPAKIGPLTGPKNDIAAFAALLREAGFKDGDIVQIGNPTRTDISRALTKKVKRLGIGKKLEKSSSGRGLARVVGRTTDKNHVVIFYWSGHAIQSGGVNYLIAIPEEPITGDADILARAGVNLGQISNELSKFAATIVIVDGSRTTLFRGGGR